ncbi:MAG: hypothetical protein C5B50_22200 [Verrucomicrobia bacterium]|nr:MAG: hypothetical protein C5B50_22200 [Verrucomicrobiota bacterium]
MLAQVSAALAATPLFAALASGTRVLAQISAAVLKPGDIVYTDSGDAVHGGYVIKVDPGTGQKTIISSGNLLRNPLGVAILPNGQLVVSDSGRLILIDPASGNQALLADASNPALGYPYGIAVNRFGWILVASSRGVVQVDPTTGQTQPVSTGGLFRSPRAVAVAMDGHIYVLDVSSAVKQIVRVNPVSGTQHLVRQGGHFKNPQGIAILGNYLFVTDVVTADGNFGDGCIIRLDAHTGMPSVLTHGQNLVGPLGIAVDAMGRLIVADPYTINPKSPDIRDGGYDGGIIRINLNNDRQSLLTRGQDSYVNPRGVAVVPHLGPK